MKIVKISILEAKTTRPQWRPVFCRIYTDEGIYGDGEAALAYGNAASAAFAQIREFAPLILGQDPINTEKIWEKLFRTTFWAQNGGPVVYAAISALDIALWDIKGKILNQPVYNLLGGATRTKIHSYASQLQLSWTWDAPNYISMSTPEILQNQQNWQ